MKKKAKEKKTPKKLHLKKSIETPPQTLQADEEKPFDFGGIPDRDLKKNLGCG